MLAEGRRGDAIVHFMTKAVGLPVAMAEGMRASPMWPAMEALAPTLAYDNEVMGDTVRGKPLPTERWASLTVPVLAVDGGASPPWARNGVQAIARALPQAQYRTLDGQTHNVAPEAIAPVLIEFFAR